MSDNKPNPSEEENDLFNKIVGLEESGGKEEETNSSEEAGSDNDSENGEESENGSENSQGSKGDEADAKDYESLYKASVEEVHKKYLPLEKKVQELQEKTGRSVDDLLAELATRQEETKAEEGEESKDLPPEVENLRQTVEELQQSFEQKTQEEVKRTVNDFKSRHKLDDKFYQDELVPVLEGVKHMKNPKTGERYSLDDGLELALSFVKKSTIDEKENKISEYEKSSGNSPSGTSAQNPPEQGSSYNEDQLAIARRMGVDLSGD